MSYIVTSGEFKTPHGRPAPMLYRGNTSDYNTLNACMTEDEYGFAGRRVTGVAVDIGAHLGGVTVGLALDNPDLRVIAVEAVPGNAELLRQNVAANGLTDRVTVLEAAAGGTKPVDVWHGYRGNESAEHHAFIGNSSLAYNTGGKVEHDTTRYETPVTLTGLLEGAGRIDLLKIDCEGCEFAVLADPATAQIPVILGEWHPVRKKAIGDVIALLDSHTVTFVGPQAGPGGFVAVAK